MPAKKRRRVMEAWEDPDPERAQEIKDREWAPGDGCPHCGGIHFGSPSGKCVYICPHCKRDIRPDAKPRCECPSVASSPAPVAPAGADKLQQALADFVASDPCPNCLAPRTAPAPAAEEIEYIDACDPQRGIAATYPENKEAVDRFISRLSDPAEPVSHHISEIHPNPGNPSAATCSECGALLVCLSCGNHRDAVRAGPVSEPLPCPWCGERPEVVDPYRVWRVRCKNPVCSFQPTTYLNSISREEAIAIWNQRR